MAPVRLPHVHYQPGLPPGFLQGDAQAPPHPLQQQQQPEPIEEEEEEDDPFVDAVPRVLRPAYLEMVANDDVQAWDAVGTFLPSAPWPTGQRLKLKHRTAVNIAKAVQRGEVTQIIIHCNEEEHRGRLKVPVQPWTFFQRVKEGRRLIRAAMLAVRLVGCSAFVRVLSVAATRQFPTQIGQPRAPSNHDALLVVQIFYFYQERVKTSLFPTQIKVERNCATCRVGDGRERCANCWLSLTTMEPVHLQEPWVKQFGLAVSFATDERLAVMQEAPLSSPWSRWCGATDPAVMGALKQMLVCERDFIDGRQLSGRPRQVPIGLEDEEEFTVET